MSPYAFVGADVFDGVTLHTQQAVLIAGNGAKVMPLAQLPAECPRHSLPGGTIMPGFVDLQVNGGGGLMFNDTPDLATLQKIATAHAGLGTRAFLPTLITDTPQKTTAAIAAVSEAIAAAVPGIVGLHLEGPHLAPSRKGAHASALIRPMEQTDLDQLLAAANHLPNLMVTLAPESVTLSQIKALSEAGVIVSLGHSDTDYDSAMRAFDAGARCTTHLFNAMSQLGSRTPGLVGATLDASGTAAGLIADGIHVHPATIRRALAAKSGPAEIFLVTDAMACAGSDIQEFTLNGRLIHRAKGRLTLGDGTLAGADLTMAQALRVMTDQVGESAASAYARASRIPAQLLRDPMGAERWPDHIDNLIYLATDDRVSGLADLR